MFHHFLTIQLFIPVSSKGTPLSSNKPPSMNQPIKQQLPLKLSSLSSGSKDFKSHSMSSPIISPQMTGSIGTPTSSRNESGPAQIFPFKLADKRGSGGGVGPPLVPHHSRTGSSPAVIQQNAYQVGSAARTNTYPKVPDRVRIRSTDGAGVLSSGTPNSNIQQGIHMAGVGAVMGQKRATQQYTGHPIHNFHGQAQHPPQPPPRHFEKEAASNRDEATNKDEQVIYF